MAALSGMNPQSYPVKLAALLIGCAILAFGIALEIIADVIMLSGESFIKAINIRFRTDFGITKVIFDVCMSLLAGALSLLMFHELVGVREGTIIASLLVGLMARFFAKKITPALLWYLPVEIGTIRVDGLQAKDINAAGMVLTIGREYGSGGKEVGKWIAKQLNFDFYDEELIHMVAKQSGIEEGYVESHEESLKSALLYDIYSQYFVNANNEQTKYDKIFEAENHVMRQLAQKGSCVIVGRKHYEHFSDTQWGVAKYYDLSIRTDKFNTEKIVELILQSLPLSV